MVVDLAIIDYGLGNLYSVKNACEYVGIQARITASKDEILSADAVILPGVGAYADAMTALQSRDLVAPLREFAASGKILMGICLGLQLLMTESYEFGRCRGLGIIAGPVVPFENPQGKRGKLKVPHVGWNRIFRSVSTPDGQSALNPQADTWIGTPLAGLPDGEYMYFVHSFYAKPEDDGLTLATSRYGDIEFSSSLRHGNIFATQFHPERSGPKGLLIYRELLSWITRNGSAESGESG